jgi:hypothetical protein
MRACRLDILALAAFSVTACGDARAPERGAAEAWQVADAPEVVIGADEVIPGHSLFRVRGATRLSDGTIVIANGGSSELRFFSAEGRHVGSVGGQGRGPGEFWHIIAMARLAGDTIGVLTADPKIAKVAGGRVVEEPAFDLSLVKVACRLDEDAPGRLLPDGSILVKATDFVPLPGCPPVATQSVRDDEVYRTTDLLLRAEPWSGRRDTLGIFPGTERERRRYIHFGRMLATAATADRIYVGDTGSDSIAVLSTGGTRFATWRVELTPRPIPPEVRSAPPETLRYPSGEVVIAPYTFQETYPVFGRLVADATGHLWVMSYPPLAAPIQSRRLESPMGLFSGEPPVVEEGGARWIVLDMTGAAVATVRTPPDLWVLEIGADYVLGVAHDSLDVETVRLYRLTR